MKTFLLALGCALAAVSHADLAIDHFTDGAVDSGEVLNDASSYMSHTAASVPGGFRNISFTNISNNVPNALTDYQVQVNPGSAINSGLGLSTGAGTMGTLDLKYTIQANANNFPLYLSATPIIRVDVPFDDMATEFRVTLTSLLGDTFTLTGTTRPSFDLDSTVDFDFSSLFAASNPFGPANIVGIDLSTTTPVSDDFIVHSIDAVAAPVPEPTTIAALGLGALAVLRRRRRS